jgi:hypothetical protein
MRRLAILPFRLAAFLIPLCAACAEQTHFTKPGTSAQQAEQDRLRCQSIMYSERTAKGKGAPNWNLFDYCMKARGYSREKVSG